jgi:type II secretory pathway component PulC
VPWEAIKKRMEEMRNQNPRFTADQVQEYLNRVKKAFDEENWQGVESEARNFRDQSKNGVHVEDDAKDLVQKIFELQRQAKIIDAFYKRKLDISGILYSPRQQSVAIVNGKQMMVGDALDAEGTITCVEIGEDYVVFETEGVEIKIGQKSGKTK